MSQLVLEIQPESKLNQARIIYRVIDHSETGGSVYVLLPRIRDPIQEELGMVEEVKELSSELQIHRLAEGQREILDYREIRIHKTRGVDGGARRCSKFASRGFLESTRVKPILQRMYN